MTPMDRDAYDFLKTTLSHAEENGEDPIKYLNEVVEQMADYTKVLEKNPIYLKSIIKWGKNA